MLLVFHDTVINIPNLKHQRKLQLAIFVYLQDLLFQCFALFVAGFFLVEALDLGVVSV